MIPYLGLSEILDKLRRIKWMMFVILIAVLVFIFLNVLLVIALSNKSKLCEFEFTLNIRKGVTVKLKTNKKDAPRK